MVQIFIEAQRVDTSEGIFLQTLIKNRFPKIKPYNINAIGGWTKLKEPANIMIMKSNEDNGGQNLVIFDADNIEKGGGYSQRLKELRQMLMGQGVNAELFLWPDNKSDGAVEDLFFSIARQDLHSVFFDCFHDFETCLGSAKDKNYHIPDLKSKMYTYISSMPLTRSQRNRLGHGEWLFDNNDYWNLKHKDLNPIVKFLDSALNSEF